MATFKDFQPTKIILDLIKQWEEGGSAKLTAYNDGLDNPTIGWGHTAGVKYGDKCTVAQAEKWLLEDIASDNAIPRREITGQMNQNQANGLMSFFFNVGGGVIQTSEHLKEYINSGNWEGVYSVMRLYINKGTPVEQGLRNRREKEIEVMKQPVTGTPETPATNTTTPKTEEEETPQGGGDSTNENTTDSPKISITITSGDYYLRNNMLYKMGETGAIFQRVRDHLQPMVQAPTTENPDTNHTNNNTNNSQEGNQETEKTETENNPAQTDTKNKLDSFLNKAKSIPLKSLTYKNIRPQENPLVCGWVDCSGYVGWCLAELYPQAWNNGYCNTETLWGYFKKIGKDFWSGDDISGQTFQAGDIIFTGDSLSFGSGNNSHVTIMIDSVDCLSCGSTPCPKQFNWRSVYQHKKPFYGIARLF